MGKGGGVEHKAQEEIARLQGTLQRGREQICPFCS